MMVKIVRYNSRYKQQIIELQTHLWSPNLVVNRAYFEWKYEQNPYLSEPLIYLAIDDGKVVGMRGFFGIQWECGCPREQFNALYADDMVVAPEHRQRGLMSTIMTFAFNDLADRGHRYLFNLSAGTVTLRSSLSMGWRSAGWVRPMRRRSWLTALQLGAFRRLKRPPRLVKTFLQMSEAVILGGSLEGRDLDRINRGFDSASGLRVADTPRCSAMAELIERTRIGSDRRIRQVRDARYLQWRFQNPLSRYRYIFLGKDRLEAFLVLQEYTSEYIKRSVLNIVNWDASNSSAQERVLDAACSVFGKGRESIIWSATLSDDSLAMLRKKKFKYLSPPKEAVVFPTVALVRPIADFETDHWKLDGQNMLDLACWDLQMLDSMHG